MRFRVFRPDVYDFGQSDFGVRENSDHMINKVSKENEPRPRHAVIRRPAEINLHRRVFAPIVLNGMFANFNARLEIGLLLLLFFLVLSSYRDAR